MNTNQIPEVDFTFICQFLAKIMSQIKSTIKSA